MSNISKIDQSDELNYRARRATRMRSAQRDFARATATDEQSAALLAALYAQWPDIHFDETNIAMAAPRSPDLLAALGFLNPKTRKVLNRPTLTAATERAVVIWFVSVAGREIGGLMLRRDRIGWCDVVKVPR